MNSSPSSTHTLTPAYANVHTHVYGGKSERKWVAKVSVMVSQLIEWQPHKWIHIHSFNDCLLLSLHLSSRSFSQPNKNILNFIKTFGFCVCMWVRTFLYTFRSFHSFLWRLFLFIYFGIFVLLLVTIWKSYRLVWLWAYPSCVCSFLIRATHTKIRECYLNDILLWLFSFLFLTFSSWHPFHSHSHTLCLYSFSFLGWYFFGRALCSLIINNSMAHK